MWNRTNTAKQHVRRNPQHRTGIYHQCDWFIVEVTADTDKYHLLDAVTI
jgi:hypothetical protein